jgi:hypothetical protein
MDTWTSTDWCDHLKVLRKNSGIYSKTRQENLLLTDDYSCARFRRVIPPTFRLRGLTA